MVINKKKGLTGAHSVYWDTAPTPGPKTPGLTFAVKEALPFPCFPQGEKWAGRLKSSPKAAR